MLLSALTNGRAGAGTSGTGERERESVTRYDHTIRIGNTWRHQPNQQNKSRHTIKSTDQNTKHQETNKLEHKRTKQTKTKHTNNKSTTKQNNNKKNKNSQKTQHTKQDTMTTITQQ